MPRKKPASPANKAGAWSEEDKDFIRANLAVMTAEEIALKLRRNPRSIKKWIRENYGVRPTSDIKAVRQQVEKVGIRDDLRNSLAWQKLKQEFTTDELAYFEEEYIDLVEQFKDDIPKTEQQQVRKAITLDIFMRRCSAAKFQLIEDINRVANWQADAARKYKARKKVLSEEQRRESETFLLNLETQLQGLRAAETARTREYNDLDNRHQKLMEALKATRDQRLTRVDSSKQSFLSILKELQDGEKREAAGREMALMKKASEREFERLARPHVYPDGSEDQPILTSRTVKLLDEQNARRRAEDEEE